MWVQVQLEVRKISHQSPAHMPSMHITDQDKIVLGEVGLFGCIHYHFMESHFSRPLHERLSQESQLLKEKCQEERSLGQEFAEEAQEWVKLTGKLSDRVNTLTAETEQMARLQQVRCGINT